METRQIKSKDRVRERGEVFTAEREVKAMVDLVNDEAVKVECDGGTFLEPACGTGNFLIEILARKCAALKIAKKPNAKDAERYAFRLSLALTKLYGIDIMPDNVRDCRKRLADFVLAEFDKVVKGKDNGARKELEDAAEVITAINIVEGDALKYKRNDGKPIVFVKWRAGDDNFRGGFSFGITPYYFDTMVGESVGADPRAARGRASAPDSHTSGRAACPYAADLFEIKQPLERSPQFAFYKIREVEEFMKGIEL